MKAPELPLWRMPRARYDRVVEAGIFPRTSSPPPAPASAGLRSAAKRHVDAGAAIAATAMKLPDVPEW